MADRSPNYRVQLLGLVASVLAPVLISVSWIVHEQYRQYQETFTQTLTSVARTLSLAAEREVATGQMMTASLTHSPLLDNREFAAFHTLASRVVSEKPGAFIVLFAPSGQMLLNTARSYGATLPNVYELETATGTPAETELPRGGAAYVRKAFQTQKAVVSDLFAGQVSGSFVVAVSVPVIRDGKTLYCLTIGIPASSFQDLVTARSQSEATGAVLFDGRGFIIARATQVETYVGKRVPIGILSLGGAEHTGHSRNLEGATVLRAIVRSPLTGWGAGAAVVEERAFGVFPKPLSASLIIGIGFILLLGGLAALVVARLQEKRGKAEALSAAKDEFIASLSHEIRNPLAAISTAAQVLNLSVGQQGPVRSSVESIQRQVGQLRHLLDDLLDTSRAIHGKLSLKLTEVELTSLIRDQVGERQQGKAVIELRLPPEDLIVKADPVRVRQMLDNLLDNAVKYGGGSIKLHVGRSENQARIEVSDDGIGLDPDLLKRLFFPFVQAPQSADRSQGGLGLGLALVKRLAELHGGSVTARSEGLHKGSTFVLCLPLIIR